MKQEKASNKALKHILCCVILLIVFVITFTSVKALNASNDIISSETEDVVPLKPQLSEELLELKMVNLSDDVVITYNEPKTIKKDINYYIDIYEDTLLFFSEAFGFNIEDIKNDLVLRNKDISIIEETNIASLTDEFGNIKTYPNTTYGIVEYFYLLVNNNEVVRNKKIVPYEGNSDYVEKLIMYYTSIYTNVDRSIALSIGAAESGYYEVKYMLRYNNVYGGMSRSGLIKYDNIELGVLSYIRLLSNNYFGKGLDTVGEIGYVYCPTVNEAGYKIASPHWINLVTKAQSKYDLYTQDITIEDIMNY